jgi:hypothetical protein
MTAYFAMLAVPAFAAMAGMGRARITLLIVAVLYWLMVGFRFKVGMDWTNYIQLYEYRFVLGAGSSLLAAITSIEPGFALLSWIAAKTGGDIYFINAVSALIFCWGFFAFARRCPEPFLAVVAATPLVVIAMAMNLTRQSAAVGIIAFLFATWERRGTVARMAFVLVAATFHFSALFVMVFVALAAKTTAFARYAAAALILAMIVVITMLAPGAWEAYSRLYISGRVQATGAIFHVAVLAFGGMLYLLLESRRIASEKERLLYRNLAIAALASVGVAFISSVAAYRFSLYLWPVAMHAFGSLPSVIARPEGRILSRILIIVGSGALLWVWLTYANNSIAWIPYRNWLF